MKIKHIVLIALTALALGLASVGVGTSAIASIRGGTTGDFQAKIGMPALAGSKPGLLSGSNSASLSDEREDAPRFTVSGGINGGVLGK